MGYIRKAPEKGYVEHPGSACCTDHMFEIFVRFGRCLCCLLPLFVNRQLPCLHTRSLQGLLLAPMHHKSLWCAKGLAVGEQSGCRCHVWLKSGYREAIPWRKVRVTKQRNVDLTTNGLWAMPLDEGWVPVKAWRLQDWDKLKKYVPIHKRRDVCPNGVPALPEKGNADDDIDSE